MPEQSPVPVDSAQLRDLLGQIAGLSRSQQLTVVCAYQRKHWQRGNRFLVENYLPHLPSLRQDREAVLDLICAEMHMREELGENPQADEYARRFPDLAEQVHSRISAGQTHSSAVARTTSDVGQPADGKQSIAQPVAFPFLGPPQEAGELGRLGGYRVLSLIGRGGMGMVFRAEDPGLHRQVALKVMSPALAEEEVARQRFLREARTTAAVEDDHIVPIHQVGEDRGLPFLTMPLLNGESLRARLERDRQLPMAEVLRIGREVAEGLAAAHANGLIHRDVKPANIWLEGERGRVKILDFGLARKIQGDPHLTQSGAILGTPAYMAPEQARGEKVDGRADLFSLGCVLYRLSTGRMPFRGADLVSTLLAVATEQPKAPLTINPQVPPALSTLVLLLLAKDPKDRPASGQAVVEALQAIEKAATSKSEQAPWYRRPLAVAAAASGLLTVLVLLGVVISLRTKHGTLVVTVSEPNVHVLIDGDDKVTLDSRKVGRVELVAGDHRLVVKRGKEELFMRDFTLKSGGETIVDAKWKDQPVHKGPDKATAQGPQPDSDRAAAEWTLTIGGGVRVSLGEADELVEITRLQDLPKQRFRLRHIVLSYNPRVTDAGFKNLRGLAHLQVLFTPHCPISDAALENLRSLPQLEILQLDASKVTDSGLEHLQSLKRLKSLYLEETAISDKGMQTIGNMRQLEWLIIPGAQITDQGLACLAMLRNLRRLDLGACTSITDRGLTSLTNMTALENLLLTGIPITDDGLASIAKLTNLSELRLVSTRITDQGLAKLVRLTNLHEFRLDNTEVSDAGLRHLTALPSLETLGLIHTKVTNAGIPDLKRLTKLTNLFLRDTNISDAGIRVLKAALPNCTIDKEFH
jgi:hypothetical protein